VGKPIVPWYTTFLSGAIAGCITVYSTMPLDVAKSRLQGLDGDRYKNVFNCLGMIVRENGVLSLWTGATPRLGRLIFSGGIVFTVYESVIQLYSLVL
jgi:solute carrier family 25 (mitochondrial citrate transporter), member 1